MTKRLTPEGRREMLAVLKAFYDAVSAEPTPQCFHDLLAKIK